jgi:hypothetical protein
MQAGCWTGRPGEGPKRMPFGDLESTSMFGEPVGKMKIELQEPEGGGSEMN